MFKKLFPYLFIAATSFLAFDTISYVTGIKEEHFPTIKGRLRYPDGYFKADPVLGHDIQPSHPPVEFDWRDKKSLIWSNQYGCFDKNERYEQPSIYIAGDSTAWGYADYNKKYGALIERELGITVAKCGVTHTGQRHQLDKLKNWIQQTQITPKLVLLMHLSNDQTNDFLYPQATVINKKFVDQAMLSIDDNGKTIKSHLPEIDRRLNRSSNQTISNKFISFAKEYSITANIIRKLSKRYVTRPIRSYLSPKTAPPSSNRKALKDFIDYASQKNIVLIIMVYGNSNKYTNDIYEFLQNNHLHVISHANAIKEHNIPFKELTWKIDGHPNDKGNRVIANAYLKYIKQHGILEKLTRGNNK